MEYESTPQPKELNPDVPVLAAQAEGQIIQAVRGIRFGSVEIMEKSCRSNARKR